METEALWTDRTEMIVGKDGIKKLQEAQVAIFGIGGVGSYVAEALCRSGVGKFVLVDYAQISLSNLNRQLHALHSTIGMEKIAVMQARMLDINPVVEIKSISARYQPANSAEFFEESYSYIADCIDIISSKVHLISTAKQKNIPIISAMGAGNQLDPTSFQIADISKTFGCPLARAVRKSLKQTGITKGVNTVFSGKERSNATTITDAESPGRNMPGSIAFVPAVVGLYMAGFIVNQILKA